MYVPGGAPMQAAFDELDLTFQEDLVKVAGDEIALDKLAKEVELVRIMLEGYFEWLAETGADQGIEILGSEQKVDVNARFPELPDVRLIAKIDVRARRTVGQDTATLFFDHKTVGDLTTPTKMLHMDEQMLHYHLCEWLDLLDKGMGGEEAEAVRSDGALYNMARKVKRTATAKPPFYDRVEVQHSTTQLRSYWTRVKGQIRDIVEMERRLDAGEDPLEVAYPNPTKDCTWDCDFFHICPMFDDGSRVEDYISNNLVVINPHARYEPENLGSVN
jgi:hypothetical protein